MTSNQENTLSMFLSVKDLINVRDSSLAADAPFTEAFNNFQQKITSIQALANIQLLDSKGETKSKINKESVLVKMAVQLSKAIMAYSNKIGNAVLEQSVHFTKSDLEKSRDTILTEKCRIISEKTEEQMSNLADYGVTNSTLTTFRTYLDDYESSLPKPKSAIAMRKSATDLLPVRIKEATNLLTGQLDNLIYKYQDSDEALFNEYNNVRKKYNIGAGGVKEESDEKVEKKEEEEKEPKVVKS